MLVNGGPTRSPIIGNGSAIIIGPLRGAAASRPSLVLQAVVDFGQKADDGQRIQAVTLPWFQIVKWLEDDPAAIFKIPPRKWEEIIAGAYRQAGFDEVILTPRSGDHGRDVIAIKRGIGSVRVIDSVKTKQPGNLVDYDDVRALLGVLPGDGASKGFVTTNTDFAPKLSEDPIIATQMPHRLELINGQRLISTLEQLAEAGGNG